MANTSPSILNHAPSPRAEKLMAWLREYSASRLDLQLADERRSFAPHVLLDLGREGFLGVNGEAEYGGLNLGPSDCFFVAEQFGAIDLSLSISILLQSFLVAQPIRLHAINAVKEKYLPDLVSGRVLGSFCLTEKSAGSDPRRIESSAHQQSDGSWRIDGEKIWSGNAAWAGVLLVFAKAFDENEKELGITGFVVDRGAAGIEAGGEARTMGLRAMPQSTTRLRDIEVGANGVLGVVGQGLQVAGETMTFARLMIAAICLGTMRRCLKIAVTYARRRRIGSGAMVVNPNVLAILEECWSEAQALEALVRHAGRILDASQTLPDEFYAAIKILAPEMLGRVCDRCLQLLGGRGYIETNEISRIYRDARVLRIFEGPTETLAAHLGARIWHDAAPFKALLQSFGGEVLASQIEATLQSVRGLATVKARDEQRAFLLRAQFLLGEWAAQALALAALRTHARATTAAVQSARRFADAAESFLLRLEGIPATDILGDIENFSAPLADFLPTAHSEEWQRDELVAGL
jgi:alkylation response protein AidB-like acyl-CoA dehydrogenase